MTAKFIGRNGSMGLVKGNSYEIVAVPNYTYPLMIEIKDGYNIISCPYSSFEILFKNWEFVG